ncbi:hypothetical protein J6590_037430 [Homalodisca vitripennis]|nr:hypothetical protein J6590_037430 [Homalodisca vitripennis]
MMRHVGTLDEIEYQRSTGALLKRYSIHETSSSSEQVWGTQSSMEIIFTLRKTPTYNIEKIKRPDFAEPLQFLQHNNSQAEIDFMPTPVDTRFLGTTDSTSQSCNLGRRRGYICSSLFQPMTRTTQISCQVCFDEEPLIQTRITLWRSSQCEINNDQFKIHSVNCLCRKNSSTISSKPGMSLSMKYEDDPDYLVTFASMKGQWR